MVDYTKQDYHKKRHLEFIEEPDLLNAWGFFADLAYFSHVKQNDRVLEFGAGLGNNLLVAKSRAQVCAVEPSSLGREIAAKAGIRVAADLEELQGEKFDTILCRHVLEHVDSPKEVLEGLRKHLDKDGRLILVVPCDSPYKMPKENDINHHLFCWNARTLCNLLSVAGFTCDKVRYEAYGARRKLLPIYHRFGGEAYAKIIRLVGHIFRFRELLVEAYPEDGAV